MTSNSNSMAAMSTRISYVYVAAALTVIAFLATVVLAAVFVVLFVLAGTSS